MSDIAPAAPGGEAPASPAAKPAAKAPAAPLTGKVAKSGTPGAGAVAEPVVSSKERKPIIPPVHKIETPSVTELRERQAQERKQGRDALYEAAGGKAAPGSDAAAAAGAEAGDEEAAAQDAAAEGEEEFAAEGAEGEEGAEEGEGESEGGEDGAADLTVVLDPMRDGEEPIEITLSDKEAADRLRARIRGAVRADQAERIREQAQEMRDQADEIHYIVDLDPAGIVLERMREPADIDHMTRFLLTQPGVLQRHAEWLADLIEDPRLLASARQLEEAQRVTRRDSMKAKVDERRELDANARGILRTLRKSVNSLAPDSFDDDRREHLYRDALNDVRDNATQRRLRTVDLKTLPGFVQRRLAFYGVAPKKAGGAPKAPAAPARTQGRPVVPARPSGKQFVAASAARRSVASAPPGAGSAAARIPAPPKGSSIKEAAAHAKAWIRRVAAGPQ